jgi:hypothetical protein
MAVALVLTTTRGEGDGLTLAATVLAATDGHSRALACMCATCRDQRRRSDCLALQSNAYGHATTRNLPKTAETGCTPLLVCTRQLRVQRLLRLAAEGGDRRTAAAGYNATRSR